MNILGIGGYSHDSAAALLVDGRVVAAVAEERLSRAKHQGGPPWRAVQYCLDTAGMTLSDIDQVGAYMRPGLRLRRRLAYRLRSLPHAPLHAAAYMLYELGHNARYVLDMRRLAGRGPRLHFMEHHPAHAASAYFASDFDDAALLSVDYIGEWTATWTGAAEGGRIRPLRTRAFPHSLGVFYSAITEYLGFRRASDEYKVMGLASYGEAAYLPEFREILRVREDGMYDIDFAHAAWGRRPGSRCGWFTRKFLDRFGPPRKPEEAITAHHQNLAASAQRALEDAVLALAAALHRDTGKRRLCMAGGVALNCAMNGRLLREGPFDEIFVQPAAGDDGIALGAAWLLHHGAGPGAARAPMTHACLGPEWSNASIRAALDRDGVDYEQPGDIVAAAADLLAEGAILGWHQGRMEFGPRALGARSILADPTRPEMKDRINAEVKFREEFRPFAPSVVEESASRYFEGCARSPFMLFVHRVRTECRDLLPAITHVDGTARVQTVARDTNPRYYALLEAFGKRRGAPVLLNTSFNVMGEPIVHSPEDALRCFRATGMDALAIGDCLVRKRRGA